SALRPELAEPHGNLAVIYNELGRPQAAARELEKFLERKPGDPVTHENLGDLHVQLALKNYKLALARNETPELFKKYQQLLQFGKPGSADHEPDTRARGAANNVEANPEIQPFTSHISMSRSAPVEVVRQHGGDFESLSDQTMPIFTPEPEGSAVGLPIAENHAVNKARHAYVDGATIETQVRTKEPRALEHPSTEQEIVNAVERWRSAWAAQNLSSYFDAYGTDFTPDADGSKGKRTWNRDAWKKYKSRVIAAKAYIHITLNNVRIQVLTDGLRAQVRFLQFFDSNNYTSQDEKEMTLKKEAHGWKIIGERVL
ncbi:MAG: hypothetical protein Q9M82_02785, partial [Mariprofundus sp.]|nr:hypothetical protein [Mariprofundus sp.]